jgi:hypothetical protein
MPLPPVDQLREALPYLRRSRLAPKRGEFAPGARVGIAMRLSDHIGNAPSRHVARSRWSFTGRYGAILGLVALALTGCGANDGAGSLLIDPGKYDAYHCNDLATRWKVLVAREKELHGLIDKANESGGGAVIGSLAYRTDYEAVLSDEKLLQRTAADKNCGFTPLFQSDQTIR